MALNALLDEWKALTPPTAEDLPSDALYKGHMTYLAMNPVVRCAMNLLWQGTRIESSRAYTLVNIFGSEEEGYVSWSEASSIDSKPCITIDFPDRVYEGRWEETGVLMDIVTFKDKRKFPKTDGISDIHYLRTS